MHDSEVFVADSSNNCVQVFAPDSQGKMHFTRAFGGKFMDELEWEKWEQTLPNQMPSAPPGQFDEPTGVAVVHGLLVVSEERRLQVLTLKGVPLQVLPLGANLESVRGNEQGLWVPDWEDFTNDGTGAWRGHYVHHVSVK